jgi:rfaE bifunctional protein nucleotidyltransferase chain/domain
MQKKKIIAYNKLSELLKKTQKNKKIVLCHGVFDLIHSGHIAYFNAAKKYGNILVVTLTSDRYVNKGPDRPFYNQEKRCKVLEGLEIIDYVCVSDFPTSVQVIKKIKPHFYVKGADYKTIKNDLSGNLLKEKKAVEAVNGLFKTTNQPLLSSSRFINQKLEDFNLNQKKYLQTIYKKNYNKKIIDWFNELKKINILLIGETIIDQYVKTNVLGKAGKDPILTINPFNKDKYHGGILSIADILAEFCNKVEVVTYLGDFDTNKNFIKKNLKTNVHLNYILKNNSPTIVKTRYLDNEGRSKILGVYDMNDAILNKKEELQIIKKLKKLIKTYNNVLVADYGHGLMTKNIINFIENNATKLAVNTQLNSANYGFNTISKYKKADLVCVHEGELRHDFRSKNESIEDLAKKVLIKVKSKNVYITQGVKGALSYNKKEKMISCPAFSKNVVDKVGAGDAFLSMSSLSYFGGLPNDIILLIGNLFGSIAVSSMGNSYKYDRKNIINLIQNLLK